MFANSLLCHRRRGLEMARNAFLKCFAFLTAALLSGANAAIADPTDGSAPLSRIEKQIGALRANVENLDNQSAAHATLLADTRLALKDLKADSQQIRQLLIQIAARSTAADLQAKYSGPNGVTQAKEDADKLRHHLATPLAPNSLGQDLQKQIEECESAITALATTVQPTKAQVESVCPNAAVIRAALDDHAKAIQAAWSKCRDQLIADGSEDAARLPPDIQDLSDSSWATLVAYLKTLPTSTCTQALSNAAADMQEHQKTSKTLADLLTFAAAACAEAGGNPYVCAGLFIAAILIDLTHVGDGDGDGHGNSNATDASNIRGGPKLNPKDMRPDAQTSLGTDPNGTISCFSVGTGAIRCQDVSTPTKFVLIDSNNARLPALPISKDGLAEFARVISNRERGNFKLCAADVSTPKGFIVLTGTNFRPATIDFTSGRAEFTFAQSQPRNGRPPDGLCNIF